MAGDVWTNEELLPSGNGIFDTATYDATLVATLASQIAIYTSNGTRAAYKAVLVGDGMLSADADPVADAYISYLARADAIQAAFAAADASTKTKWITITSYGAGARPIIRPNPAGVGTLVSGIRFNTHSFTGGYKIKGVDIDGAYVVGITNDLGRGNLTPHANGIWLEDCKLTNCTGMPVRTSGIIYPGLVPPYTQMCASGFTWTNCFYVCHKNVEIGASDAPGWFWGGQNVWLTGQNYHDLYVQAFSIGGLTDVAATFNLSIVQNFLYEASEYGPANQVASPISGAGPGFFKAESGPVIAHIQDFVIRGLHVHDVKFLHADAIAIDYEGQGLLNGVPTKFTGLIQGCTLENNSNGAMLDNTTNSQPLDLFIFDGNTVSMNGAAAWTFPMFCGRRDTITSPRYVTRNAFTKGAVGQKIFGGGPVATYSPTTNTPGTGTLFAVSPSGSNTII